MDLDDQTDEQLAARDMELQALLVKRVGRDARAALSQEREELWAEIRYRQARAENKARVAKAKSR